MCPIQCPFPNLDLRTYRGLAVIKHRRGAFPAYGTQDTENHRCGKKRWNEGYTAQSLMNKSLGHRSFNGRRIDSPFSTTPLPVGDRGVLQAKGASVNDSNVTVSMNWIGRCPVSRWSRHAPAGFLPIEKEVGEAVGALPQGLNGSVIGPENRYETEKSVVLRSA